jgi:REP element-mobilizing transposase RayT
LVWSARVAIEHAAYHTISVTRGRQRFFADPNDADLVVQAIRHASDRNKTYVLAYAVMPDHLHLLIVPRRPYTVSTLMMEIKRYSAKQINARHGRRGTLWQQSFYDRLVRGDAHLSATIQYIEHNPVAARLAHQPGEYRFSSASPEGFQDLERFWNDE